MLSGKKSGAALGLSGALSDALNQVNLLLVLCVRSFSRAVLITTLQWRLML